MTPPLTVQQRKIRTVADQMTDELQSAVLAELQRLWRDLVVRLHHLDAVRNPDQVQKRLAKQSYMAVDLWWMFQNRLKNRILDAILKGEITLTALQNAHLLARAGRTVEIDPEQFALDFEAELGMRITQTTQTLQRQVAREVVQWYNTPGKTLGDLKAKLQPSFGEYRAQMIARTEIANLYSGVQGKIAEQLDITEFWIESRRDELVCVKPLPGPDGKIYKGCRELHGKVFKVGQRMPPIHIQCRCTAHLLVPSLEGGK